MQDFADQETSGVWEDLFAELSIPDLKHAEELVAILDDARIDRFQLQTAFEEEYQRIEFQYELRLQQEGEVSETDVVKKSIRRFLKRPEGFPKETTMNLTTNTLKNRIFMKIYDQEIKRMQDENDYRIYCDRTQLRIFMREGYELNMLCRNKLDEMRNQLSIFIEKDQHTLTIFRTSQKLTDSLAKTGVNVELIMLRGVQTGYFYSTTLKIGEIQSRVNEIARLNVTILNFHTKELSQIQNECLFTLIAEAIQHTALKLEEDYETEIEFNHKCHCVVIHKKHACFGVEVQQQLKSALSQLVLLSFKSQSVRQFSNNVRKQLKQLTFLKQKIKSSRNQSFLAINRKLLSPHGTINVKNLQELLRLIKMVIQADLNVKVYIHHLDEKEGESRVKRVLQLSQEQNMSETEESIHDKWKKTFKFKDWSQSVFLKRQKNMLQFIHKLAIPQKHQKELTSFVQSFIEEDNQRQSHNSSHASKSLLDYKSMHSSMNGKDIRKELSWFNLDFLMPPVKLIEEDDKAFLLGKRKKDYERLFEDNAHVKCRVTALELSNRIVWPTEVEQKPVLIKNCFKSGKMNEDWQYCSFDQLKVTDQAFIVYLSKPILQNLEFVPVLIVKRIQ